MAHFAEIVNGKVSRVVVVSNNEITVDGVEREELGQTFLQSIYGENTLWLQTSYHGRIRKNYAGPGFTYDARLDAFIPPQPYPSWRLDETCCVWVPPIPAPENLLAAWDEVGQQWTVVDRYPPA